MEKVRDGELIGENRDRIEEPLVGKDWAQGSLTVSTCLRFSLWFDGRSTLSFFLITYVYGMDSPDRFSAILKPPHKKGSQKVKEAGVVEG